MDTKKIFKENAKVVLDSINEEALVEMQYGLICFGSYLVTARTSFEKCNVPFAALERKEQLQKDASTFFKKLCLFNRLSREAGYGFFMNRVDNVNTEAIGDLATEFCILSTGCVLEVNSFKEYLEMLGMLKGN